MVSQGCAHARAFALHVGDVIEPAALRRNVAYREFFDSIKAGSQYDARPCVASRQSCIDAGRNALER